MVLFFFKQKTAYEMRISDWSSDVCSSDLAFQAYAIATVQGALGIAACALMPGLLQDLAPPHLRARVLAALTIAAPFALAISPMATGLMSSLIDGPRDILLAMTIVNLRSEEHTSELQSLMRIQYAVFWLKKQKNIHNRYYTI